MRVFVVLALALWPALAHAERTYTNADLVDLEVPGAYTNEDLRRLSPLAVQRQAIATPPPYAPRRAPSEAYQAIYDELRLERDLLAAELAIERERVAFSESAFAGDPSSEPGRPRLGYKARVAGLMAELAKRVALLDVHLEALRDQARRAGASIDTR
jgi:hypothetical protein